MQTWLIAALALGVPAALGALITYFFCRSRRIAVEERLNAAQRELRDMSSRLESVSIKLQTVLDSKARMEQDSRRLPVLEGQVVELKDENVELREQVARLKRERELSEGTLRWIERAEERLREIFQSLASQALESNTDHFLKRAQTQLDDMLNQARGDWNQQKSEFQKLVQPLEKTLEALDGQVRDLEQKREGVVQRLEEQLRQIGQTHQQLQTSTTSLVQVLKGPGVRSTWGEWQLRRVVEMAGMMDHVDFIGRDERDGKRPDVIVHLPNKGILPIDAKTPMQDYLEAMEVSDDDLRKAKLGAHSRAMRARIQELAEQPYREQFERTAEVVALFVPNDACLGVAFEHDPELLEFATQHGVLLTTPVTLLALLKAVAYGWQQQETTENARQIAIQGKNLYKRLNAFLNHLSDLGRRLDHAVRDYNKAVVSLESRVLPTARRLREMGMEGVGVPSASPVEHQAIPPPKPDLDEEAVP